MSVCVRRIVSDEFPRDLLGFVELFLSDERYDQLGGIVRARIRMPLGITKGSFSGIEPATLVQELPVEKKSFAVSGVAFDCCAEVLDGVVAFAALHESDGEPVARVSAALVTVESFLVVLDGFRDISARIVDVSDLFGDRRRFRRKAMGPLQIGETSFDVARGHLCPASLFVHFRVITIFFEQGVVGRDSFFVLAGTNEARGFFESPGRHGVFSGQEPKQGAG